MTELPENKLALNVTKFPHATWGRSPTLGVYKTGTCLVGGGGGGGSGGIPHLENFEIRKL